MSVNVSENELVWKVFELSLSPVAGRVHAVEVEQVEVEVSEAGGSGSVGRHKAGVKSLLAQAVGPAGNACDRCEIRYA